MLTVGVVIHTEGERATLTTSGMFDLACHQSGSNEVMGEEDPFKGRADRAQSDANLKPGHTYIVRMNDQQGNPRIEEVLQEIVEDLTPYTDALKALGNPSTAQQVADEIAGTIGIAVTSAAVKRRLDQLVESGQIFPTRSKGAGRPYLYEIAGVPAEVQGDA